MADELWPRAGGEGWNDILDTEFFVAAPAPDLTRYLHQFGNRKLLTRLRSIVGAVPITFDFTTARRRTAALGEVPIALIGNALVQGGAPSAFDIRYVWLFDELAYAPGTADDRDTWLFG